MPKKGENIYKRKDGRWEGRYIVSRGLDGKPKYQSVYGKTYKEIKSKMSGDAEKTVSGKANAGMTAAEWTLRYIQSVKGAVKISTYNMYLLHLKNHIEPFFGKLKLDSLTETDLQKFVYSMSGLSASSVRVVFSTLKDALCAAYKLGFVKSNVWSDIKLPKMKKHETYAFSQLEQRMIENALNIEGDPNEIGILICLYTGLRIGELCGLKWSDINFAGATLSVNRTIQRVTIDGKSILQEMPPKSLSSERKIPIQEFLLRRLKKLKNNSSSVYVLSMNSHAMDPRTYQNLYKRVLKRAGVEYMNFHCLRHTFSVRALENGFDIKTLSDILGHGSPAVTMNIYAHSLDKHKRMSMERLSEIREVG